MATAQVRLAAANAAEAELREEKRVVEEEWRRRDRAARQQGGARTIQRARPLERGIVRLLGGPLVVVGQGQVDKRRARGQQLLCRAQAHSRRP